MRIISLGFGCQIKVQIETFYKREETQFFDWLITDFKSVLYILKNINDRQFMKKENFTCDSVFYERETWTKCYKIENVKCKMISTHDIVLNKNFTDCLDEFISKYNRRLDRLINVINSNENIHMIHCIDHMFTDRYIVSNEDVSNFKKYLSDINPNNNCFLHIVISPKHKDKDINLDHLIQDNVYVYYLSDAGGYIDWKNNNFNWHIVFDSINAIG